MHISWSSLEITFKDQWNATVFVTYYFPVIQSIDGPIGSTIPPRFGGSGGQYVPEALFDCLIEREGAHSASALSVRGNGNGPVSRHVTDLAHTRIHWQFHPSLGDLISWAMEATDVTVISASQVMREVT